MPHADCAAAGKPSPDPGCPPTEWWSRPTRTPVAPDRAVSSAVPATIQKPTRSPVGPLPAAACNEPDCRRSCGPTTAVLVRPPASAPTAVSDQSADDAPLPTEYLWHPVVGKSSTTSPPKGSRDPGARTAHTRAACAPPAARAPPA